MLEEYITTQLKPALLLVGTNLVNKSKCNQMAARLMGYASYESLEPLLKAEKEIKEAIYSGSCKHQSNNHTFKAGNALFVFDASNGSICMKGLTPRTETHHVCENSCDDALLFASLKMDMSNIEVSKEISLSGSPSLSFNLKGIDENGAIVLFDCQIARTSEGVIFDVYFSESGDLYGTLALSFCDYSGHESVDQYKAMFANTLNSADGDYFHWVLKVNTEYGLRYLRTRTAEGMEFPLSDLIFNTVEEAKEALESGAFGYTSEDYEDGELVLVNVQKRIDH